MKPWYKSKTVWFNVLMMVVLTAEFLTDIEPQLARWTILIAGIGNIMIRVFFTQTPIKPLTAK